jgi:PAS domain S-box-containing protein
MRTRHTALLFRDQWSAVQRWLYAGLLLAALAALCGYLLPDDGSLQYLTFALALPLVFFFFGRGPGIAGLGIGMSLGMLFHPAPWATVAFLLLGATIGWLINLLQTALLTYRESERLEIAVMDAQSDWIARFDPQGHFLYKTAAAEQIYGTETSRIGNFWHPIPVKEDVPLIEAELSKLSPAHPVVSVENRIHSGDGGIRWGHFINKGIFDAKGELVAFQCEGRDITERKSLELRLAKVAEELESLYEHAPCAYYSLDPDGVFQRANRLLCEWVGQPAEALVGKRRIADFLSPASSVEFLRRHRAFQAEGRIENAEFEVLNPDGSIRYVNLNSNAIYDADGRFILTRSAMVDVTARKQAEVEIKHLNDSLERRIKERTRALRYKSEELESFTYSLSHDLRAPLRAINGWACILREDMAEGNTTSWLDGLKKIEASSEQMARLMDALLSLSALGNSSLANSEIDNHRMVQLALDVLRQTQAEGMADIHIGPLPPAIGAPELIRQVWENLLSNAIKFSARSNPPRIDVGYDAGLRAYFVRDNGIGFDISLAQKIFQPFERMHGGHKYPGTGIGLSVVERVVRRHGGKVWCEAAPGSGATFYFSLPNRDEAGKP